jgi:hypothetical protein
LGTVRPVAENSLGKKFFLKKEISATIWSKVFIQKNKTLGLIVG